MKLLAQIKLCVWRSVCAFTTAKIYNSTTANSTTATRPYIESLHGLLDGDKRGKIDMIESSIHEGGPDLKSRHKQPPGLPTL